MMLARWPKPVLAGDTIRFTSRLKDKIDSKSRPMVGLLVAGSEGTNQRGELVFGVIGKMFVERHVPYNAATAEQTKR